jgi:5'-3' exonuclease
VLSDIYEVGEGEKKIVNYINKYHYKTNETIVVYSPDADVILLCMILSINNIYYLRHNQQTSLYDLIDIKMLKENIAYYINNHPDFSKETFDIHRINYDIVCISTLFGNDFVPKIESLNVKQGFQHILNTYLQMLLKFKEKSYYLVKIDDDHFSMSFIFLKNMLKALLPIEEDFIKHNNVYNKYINAGKIKDVFDYMEINERNIVPTVNNLKNEYRNLTHTIQTHGNLSYFENYDELMKSLKKSLNIVIDDQCVNTTYLSNKEFIQLLIDVYSKTREFPRININLNSYSHHMDDQYHKKKLEQNHITDPYDKEIYRFDNMLDEYYVKFNNSPLILTQNRIIPFYAEYFHVKLFDGKFLSKDAKNVMHDYLEGILWVFNSYFNDKTYVNTWCYLHEKSPLLTHFVMYLDGIDHKVFQDTYDQLDKYYVSDLSTYFTPLEQLIYVSPIVENVLKLLPENYRSFIESDNLDPFLKKYFINIEQVVNKLWSEKVSSEIDCKGVGFMTKCIVKSISKLSAKDDKLFLKAIRKVPQTAVSIRRSRNTEPKY